MNISSLFINHIHGFSNVMVEFITKLQEQYRSTTYLHDYTYLMPNNPQPNYKIMVKNDGVCTNTPINYLANMQSNKWVQLKQQILHNSDQIICPSMYTRYMYQKQLPTIPIRVLYHQTVDTSLFNQVKCISQPLPLKQYTVLCYGELSPIKGLHVIEHLIDECPSVQFVIHGKHTIQSSANCTVFGEYNHQDLPTIIDSTQPDVILFCSQFCETFCFALIPALISTVPIICPNFGAFVELGAGRKNTFFCDTDKLTNAMLHDIFSQFTTGYYADCSDLLQCISPGCGGAQTTPTTIPICSIEQLELFA
jgi:glycosyltransferase involved in cell wall biosynthesis